MKQSVLLGYEVGTGNPVEVPITHMVVTGQTQNSGKTTTLEALVARSGVTALAFVTKRGEGAFAQGNRVQPYFRDRADWQFVDQLLGAVLSEKNKFLRPWIIKICRSTKSLADVLDQVRAAAVKARGISEGVYTQLEAYLELIVPEIAGADLANTIELEHGLNVMDVSGFDTPMQMLFVQSAIDWVNAHRRSTVVVVPEAWEFIPEGKGSPVKASAIALVRKGAALRNFIWVDSQDTAGVDKVILRGCTVWLLGVQREANEIKRNLDNIPAGLAKPRAQDVALLERGQFFACHGRHVVRTYVQPVWLSPPLAQAAAIAGETAMMDAAMERVAIGPLKREDKVDEKEARALREENKRLTNELHHAARRIEMLDGALLAKQAVPSLDDNLLPPRKGIEVAGVPGDLLDAIYAEIMRRISADPVLIRLSTEKPAIEVKVERRVISMDGSSLRGRIAKLLADGGFDHGITNSGIRTQLKRTGADTNNVLIGKVLADLLKDGFVTRSGDHYTAVEGMKVNVVGG